MTEDGHRTEDGRCPCWDGHSFAVGSGNGELVMAMMIIAVHQNHSPRYGPR